jgi:hypothetical protein
LKDKLPGSIAENINSEIDGIFNLIRNQRNDSEHPTGKDVERFHMFVNLQLFVAYCRNVYGIVEWLDQQESI